MGQAMTPRQRIRAVLRGDMPDQTPLTIYWIMLPRGERERRLRAAGLAVVERMALYWTEYPHCDIIAHEYWEGGYRTIRDVIRTPVGEATAIRKVGLGYGSEMYVEHFIKRREDYRVMEFYVRDAVYHANHAAYHVAEDRLGEDGYVLPHIGYSPYMQLQNYWLGVEQCSFHLADYPDEFFSLYHALRQRHREIYRLYAESPAEAVLYCGNIVPNVVGPRRFAQYILPCLNEFADVMHDRGKLVGCHLDADNIPFIPAVAGSKLDIIEAFTPQPDCDMTVALARQSWPGKILWCNFPSSVHLADDATIAETTRQMLREAGAGERFLLGVTEDIPEPHLWHSLNVIQREIHRTGAEDAEIQK